jgi:hypothetical protein
MDNPYQLAAGPAGSGRVRDDCTADWRRLRRLAVLSFYLAIATFGAMQVSLPQSGFVAPLLALMAASTAAYGCVVDARFRGRPIVQSVHWIMFVTWPMAVPVYLIYSRKLRGVALIVMHLIGLVVISTAAFNLAGYLAYGKQWFRQFGH